MAERTLLRLISSLSCSTLRLFKSSKHSQSLDLNYKLLKSIGNRKINYNSAGLVHSSVSEDGSSEGQGDTQYKFNKIGWCVAGGCLGFALITSTPVNAAEQEQDEPKFREIDKHQEKKVIKNADALYSQDEVDGLYEFLKQYELTESAQISWRLARACCDKAKHCDAKSKERKDLMHEGFLYAQRSVSLDGKCGACHRWYAVMLNYVGDYEGNKQKIKYSYIVRDHFKKSIEMDPKDATSMYCLGQWCYFFADMSWYTQKIAALIFGTPPTSTFQEALEYFTMAEETDPNFYSMNHLMLARTYLKLNDKTKAREHLVKARDLPVKSPDDKQAHAESIEQLSQL